MPLYTYDASDSSSLIKEGDYEVIIERMERKVTPNGKEKVSIMFRIRSDVEQSYKNKCIFEDIWTERDNPNVFNRKRINQLLGTQVIEDGHEFETINDVFDFLLGSYLQVHISIELDTYRGEDVNMVSYYKKTNHKPQTLGSADAKPVSPVVDNQANVISDDDIPF